ncbi:hypothetical protein INQ23_26015, partial [Escherichia coli]|nr:hypothetical protein [Escherichia coli]
EIYMRASGSGAGSFGIVAPMISVAGIGQAAMPSFTPTPPPDSEQDIVSRLFYDKAGNRTNVNVTGAP